MTSIDTRTPAEIEYDRLALSSRTAQPADEPLSADEEKILSALIRITADGTPNKYDTGEWSMHWTKVETPIITMPDGSTIVGTYEVDGSRDCVHLQSKDGQFYCGPDGGLSGDWADHYFEELTQEQVEKLRELFTGPLLPTLIDAAKAWVTGSAVTTVDPFDAGYQAGYNEGLKDGRMEAQRAA
jgi:hypothetical protein